MLYVGLGKIGRFELWVTPPSPFHPERFDMTLDYYNCFVTEITNARYYVNLHKSPTFPQIDYRIPPKPMAVKKSKSRSGEILEEDIPDTIEQAIYRVEHKHYEDRKDMQMPMWLLHRSTIEKIMQVCQSVSLESP